MKREERNSRSISEIINAAVKLYAESDSLEISLNELCRENSISKGKFYHYFSSKEALLEAALNFITDDLCKSITAFRVYPEKSLEENLNAYFAERVNFWIAHPDNYLVIYKLLPSQDYSYKKDICISEPNIRMIWLKKCLRSCIFQTKQGGFPIMN